MALPPFMFPGVSPPPSRRNSLPSGVESLSIIQEHTSNHPRPPKERDFVWKYGKKHHRHLPDKVPWPLSYDQDLLQTELLEVVWNGSLGHPVTWLDLKDNPPKRLLDIGCGSGAWAFHATQEWPECDIVAFDLVDIQSPLKNVQAASRIQWAYGNFLSTRLPFEEDSFDYVHVSFLEKCVPESKWGSLFQEIERILRPGGAIEFVTEDIIFPLLPRWFTGALRTALPASSQTTGPDTAISEPEHDHTLLESLFYAVFERRFINLKPTAVITGYFTPYFTNVIPSPARAFSMPPYQLPPRPASLEACATSSKTSYLSHLQAISEDTVSYASSTTLTSFGHDSLCDTLFDTDISPNMGNDLHWSQKFVGYSTTPKPTKGSSQEEWLRLHSPDQVKVDKEFSLSSSTQALHLWRAVRQVLACREAMWEELEDRLVNSPHELQKLGWKPYSGDIKSTDAQQSNRSQFEDLMFLYEHDMEIRLALGNSLEKLGWSRPTEDVLTKSEIYRQERLYRAIEDAQARGEDSTENTVCRVARAIFGFKSNV